MLNFIIIRTDKGGRYARKILNSVKWLNENKYPQYAFTTQDLTIGELLAISNDRFKALFEPENTIIHARAANPRTKWTIKLRELENLGYKVVNSVDCLELTSNKLACSLHLQGRVNHPKTWEWQKNWDREVKFDFIDKLLRAIPNDEFVIAKPLTSLEQGANVKKIPIRVNPDIFRQLSNWFDSVPGNNKIVIQEYIPYTALHRVIVIGGKALPYTFVDYANDPRKNGEWKVSCCLNRTTMKLNENADQRLLQLAEETQKAVGGVINFIDIFEYGEDWDPFGGIRALYTNAEINTACSLNIHEKLAKEAGRKDWNIHYRIANELVKQLLNR